MCPVLSIGMNGRKERRLGAALGLVKAGVGVATRLLLIPIILHYLNSAEFGLYQLIGAFVGYLALIDFGISDTLGRFVARYQANDDRTRQENVFSMCLIIYSILGLIITFVGWVIYQNIELIFSKSLTLVELTQAKNMFVILVASISATVLGKAFIGVNAGHERFVFTRVVDLVCSIGKIGVIAAVLSIGYRAVGIVVVEALINITIMLLNALYAISVLNVRFKLHCWDWHLFSELLGFAFWTFLAALVLQINFRLGSVLLGIMATTTMVGIYSIALQINTLYNSLSTVIAGVYLPQITRLVVGGASGDQLVRAIIGPSRYQLMIIGIVLGGFILFGRQFITLWAGSEYIEAWSAALLIIIPVTIPLCQNTILSILYAKMLNRTRALITLFFAILSGITAVLLIPSYGLLGPAMATGLVLLIGHGLTMNVYYHRFLGLDMFCFFRKVAERILPTIIGITFSGALLNYLPVGHGWNSLIIRLVLFAMAYGVLMFVYGMNAHERHLVITLVQSAVGVLGIKQKQD